MSFISRDIYVLNQRTIHIVLIHMYSVSAIDVSRDLFEAMEAVIGLGFERVLTSGGESTALEGLPNIAALVKQVNCWELIIRVH